MLVVAWEHFDSLFVEMAAELDFVVLFFEVFELDLALRPLEAEVEVVAFEELVDFTLL